MIDIHSHILPGLDDGANTMEIAIEMLKEAEKQGIKKIIATPHHQNGRYVNEREKVLVAVDELNEHVRSVGLKIEVLPGQEVRLHGEIFQGLEDRKILTLDKTNKFMLIEFPSNHIPRYAERLFYDLQSEGITPIIAHPERNTEIMEKPDMLYKFIKAGALSQVTAQSVMGGFDKKTMKFSHQLIEHNLTHFIASDAHGVRTRGFKMYEAFETISKEFGYDYVYMFKENAELLLEGLSVNREIPEKIEKRKKFLGIF